MDRNLTAGHLVRLSSHPLVGVLATADEHGRPHTSVVSWLIVTAPRHVHLAIAAGTRHLANVRRNPRLALQILCDDLVLVLAGSAEILQSRLRSAPFPLANVRLTVDDVVDQSPAGVRFRGPAYEFAPGKAHRADVERDVLAELSASHHLYPTRPVTFA